MLRSLYKSDLVSHVHGLGFTGRPGATGAKFGFGEQCDVASSRQCRLMNDCLVRP